MYLRELLFKYFDILTKKVSLGYSVWFKAIANEASEQFF